MIIMLNAFIHAAYENEQAKIEAEKTASALERLPARVLEKIASGQVTYSEYLEHGDAAITRALVKQALAMPPAVGQIGKALVGAAKANPLAAAGVVGGAAVGAKKGYDAGGVTGAVAGGIGGGVVGGAAGGAAHLGVDTAKRMSSATPPSLQQAASKAWNHRVGETARTMRAEGVNMSRGAHRGMMIGKAPTAIPAAAPTVDPTAIVA